MRQILLSVAFFSMMIAQGHSQNSVKKEKIKALFVLMHQDSLIVKTIDAMTVSMVKNMTKVFSDTTFTNHGVDASKMTQKLVERSLQRSKQNALRLLNEDMVNIYDKYFTVEEIDEFSQFYKSRSGQKLLTQTPEITKDVMNVMSTKYQADFQQSLMKDIQEIISDMTEQTTKSSN